MRSEDWGLTPYKLALELQLERVEKVADDSDEEMIVFCSHPSVVTTGRGTRVGDVTDWTGEVIEVQRGGRATYHGPHQLVIYPIIDLKRRGRNVEGYLRALETAMIETLGALGLQASRAPDSTIDPSDSAQDNERLYTGVWVDSKKVASIGIAVKKWVTYHGLALNLSSDPIAFSGINPCGFSRADMGNLKDLLKIEPDLARIRSLFTLFLEDELEQLRNTPVK